MEVTFIGGLTESTFTVERAHGEWPGFAEGLQRDRTDSFCHRMLAGGPARTADAAHDSTYADVPSRTLFGITSYVGVPVRNRAGEIVATLCGVDRGSVPVSDAKLAV